MAPAPFHKTTSMFLDFIFSSCFPGKKLSDLCEKGDYREFRKCSISSYDEIVEVDDDDRVPLLCAIQSGSVPIVKRMGKYGDIGRFSTIFGWTILHEAVSSGSLEMVLYVLDQCHVKPYLKTSGGYSPIHMSITSGRIDILDVLLQYTPFNLVSSSSLNGITPLILAIMSKNVEMVNMIHRAGGSLIKESYQGMPAMFLARKYGIGEGICLPRGCLHPASGLPLSIPVPIWY